MKSNRRGRIKRFFYNLGPGLITGASDDDPSGIATYSQAGAQLGLLTLWTALITFPLMTAIQEMCARIGIVTAQGLASNIKKHYPKPILFLVIFLSIPAILLNIAADIAGMGAVAHLVFPMIAAYWFSSTFIAILIVAIVFLSYDRMVNVLKYLCLSLLAYIIIPFLYEHDWMTILKHTFIPHIPFNKQSFTLLTAILGTTISPYLFFWQATMEAEKRNRRSSGWYFNHQMIRDMATDVRIGMFNSNLIMYFIILTTGTLLYQSNTTEIATVEQTAKALEPLAGKYAYTLFALGVLGTGFLAIPVLSGCLSYILSSTFNWKAGLDKPFYRAKIFYSIIILSLLLGFTIDLLGVNPIKVLLYTSVLYGLTAPVLIVMILLIANNKKIMGKFVNGVWSNLLGGLTLLLMILSALFFIYLYLTE
jgi:NRAMP (natural resistance-associated macrophage protein)-like metal ion transporter